MYLVEWGLWKLCTESQVERVATEAETNTSRLIDDVYEADLDTEIHFNSVSKNPRTRGPVFAMNDTFLEMRSGASEEKRGLITIATLGGILPMLLTVTFGAAVCLYLDISEPSEISLLSATTTLIMTSLDITLIYLYFRYGFQLTRLEIFTSRHLLIRFNRKTQQVYLHRPQYCGGIVTLPWKSTGSTATYPADDSLSHGMRLGLVWHPSRTGLPHMESTLLGKQGQGGSELRDEWEFIRRYMEEGPDAVPRPRLSTQLPSPIQAFSAQFEGMSRFLRNGSWLFKVILLMVWPAFVILGTAHWVSLMLCWRPRWPKVIREAGLPGKPVPPLTTLADYPPDVQERLLANADRWQLKPGKRPEKKPRRPRARSATKDASSI